MTTDTEYPDIKIHNSDIVLYKRCRRKWDWLSGMRESLVPIDRPAKHLWFGTGWHHMMERVEGVNPPADPLDAFREYRNSFTEEQLPSGEDDSLELAAGMFNHYQNWLKGRDHYKTAVDIDGKPLVELYFEIALPEEEVGRPRVFYVGTIDRVVVDEWGRYWLMDYKSVKSFDSAKLEMDPQISKYMFAAKYVFDIEVEGMIYLQMKKVVPRPPKFLKNGDLSVDKRQPTTWELARRAMVEINPRLLQIEKYHEYLKYLATQETPDKDRFIERTLVRRSNVHLENIYAQLIEEARDMINPDQSLYPNPTKDCSWDCPFKSPCIAKDDGSDYRYMLENMFVRQAERNLWKEGLESNYSADPEGSVEEFAF